MTIVKTNEIIKFKVASEIQNIEKHNQNREPQYQKTYQKYQNINEGFKYSLVCYWRSQVK